MRKLLLLIPFCTLPILVFPQKKKTASNEFAKEYNEYLIKSEGLGKSLYDLITMFKIGNIFDKSTINTEPSVKYNEKMDAYKYIYKLDDYNLIFLVKNGKIIEKEIIVFDLISYQELFNALNIQNKEFIVEKGFKINEEEFLRILKSRQKDYDSYSFDFTGLEYYNLLDYIKSEK